MSYVSKLQPLRDIAVVSGQTARFECIVQAEPQPNILWSKDGRIDRRELLELRNPLQERCLSSDHSASLSWYVTNVPGKFQNTIK